VGFQTKLKHGDTDADLPHDPGPEQARFARLGRPASEYIHSTRRACSIPNCASDRVRTSDSRDRSPASKAMSESAAIGLCSRGRFAAAEILGDESAPPPSTTALGALLDHITGGAAAETFQPHEREFRMFPAIMDGSAAATGKKPSSTRALCDLGQMARMG